MSQGSDELRVVVRISRPVRRALADTFSDQWVIVSEREQKNDFGGFLLTVVATVTAECLMRLIDLLAASVVNGAQDVPEKRPSNGSSAVPVSDGRQVAIIVYQNEDFDMNDPRARKRLKAAASASATASSGRTRPNAR